MSLYLYPSFSTKLPTKSATAFASPHSSSDVQNLIGAPSGLKATDSSPIIPTLPLINSLALSTIVLEDR